MNNQHSTVSMSAASYKSNEFHLVMVLKQNVRIAVRLNNGGIQLNNHGGGRHTQLLQECGHGHGVRDGLWAAVQMDLHRTMIGEKEWVWGNRHATCVGRQAMRIKKIQKIILI